VTGRGPHLGRPIALLAGIAACGGAKQPTSTTSNTADDPVAHSASPTDPAAVCDRILALGQDGCEVFSSYGLSRDECIADLQRSLERRGADARAAATAAGACVLDHRSCAEVGTCLGTLGGGGDEGLRDCADRGSGAAVGRPRAEWEQRRGATATRLSEVPSTKDEPIEVCTIPEEMTWLLRVRCDDGSYPFPDYDHAHAARVGNVGPGGACGAIIDLYQVPCPEGAYQVYVDAYVCPVD